MARYIDADALINAVNGFTKFYHIDLLQVSTFIDAVMDMPTADVREVKHGKWKINADDLFPVESTMECSVCHHEQPLNIDDNYCPNCGADMRGES